MNVYLLIVFRCDDITGTEWDVPIEIIAQNVEQAMRCAEGHSRDWLLFKDPLRRIDA